MKGKKALGILLISALFLTACGGEKQSGATEPEIKTESAVSDGKEEAPAAASAVALCKQGNPTTISLADIAEESKEDYKAWIKVSTAFDPELSVYSADLIPENTQAIVVQFQVSNMDCGEQDMYWCYQLITADGTVSLWDDTSAADKLHITGDGTYQFVFDAGKALGMPIVTVESLQMVFPGLTETTQTTVELLDAKAITDAGEVSLFTSGKLD